MHLSFLANPSHSVLSPIYKNGALFSLSVTFNNQFNGRAVEGAPAPSHSLGCVRHWWFHHPLFSPWQCCGAKDALLHTERSACKIPLHFAFSSEVMETASLKCIHLMASVETGSSAKGNTNFKKPSKHFASGLHGRKGAWHWLSLHIWLNGKHWCFFKHSSLLLFELNFSQMLTNSLSLAVPCPATSASFHWVVWMICPCFHGWFLLQSGGVWGFNIQQNIS